MAARVRHDAFDGAAPREGERGGAVALQSHGARVREAWMVRDRETADGGWTELDAAVARRTQRHRVVASAADHIGTRDATALIVANDGARRTIRRERDAQRRIIAVHGERDLARRKARRPRRDGV